jgi:hypothetical protein
MVSALAPSVASAIRYTYNPTLPSPTSAPTPTHSPTLSHAPSVSQAPTYSTEPSTSPTSPTQQPSSSHSSRIFGCFSGNEYVYTNKGMRMLISEVRVGDRLLAITKDLRAVTAAVVSVPHPVNSILAVFVSLLTESGAELRLTRDHLVFTGKCLAARDSFRLLRAGSVRAGDCLLTLDGTDRVKSVAKIRAAGLYTIVTDAEFLLVSSFITSPFEVNHASASLFYTLHRSLYRFCPSLLSAIASGYQALSYAFLSISI